MLRGPSGGLNLWLTNVPHDSYPHLEGNLHFVINTLLQDEHLVFQCSQLPCQEKPAEEGTPAMAETLAQESPVVGSRDLRGLYPQDQSLVCKGVTCEVHGYGPWSLLRHQCQPGYLDVGQAGV